MPPVIILGAGGHARVLLELAQLAGLSVLGLVDDSATLIGQTILDVPVLGDFNVVIKHKPKVVRLVNGVGGTRVSPLRRHIFERFKSAGYTFQTLVHPNAIVSPSAQLGEGCQILAGAIVQPFAVLGQNVIVNTGASVDHDCRVGSHTHLAPRSALAGEVTVGEGAHVGLGALVLQGLYIGESAMIGAGALVLKDVPAETTALGVPAKIRS